MSVQSRRGFWINSLPHQQPPAAAQASPEYAFTPEKTMWKSLKRWPVLLVLLAAFGALAVGLARGGKIQPAASACSQAAKACSAGSSALCSGQMSE